MLTYCPWTALVLGRFYPQVRRFYAIFLLQNTSDFPIVKAEQTRHSSRPDEQRSNQYIYNSVVERCSAGSRGEPTAISRSGGIASTPERAREEYVQLVPPRP